MRYKLKTKQETFKKQLRAFINDTGWTGIFKINLHKKSEPHVIIGEESLGVTKGGQLVKITFDGETLIIES
jgi:hypothetical protein